MPSRPAQPGPVEVGDESQSHLQFNEPLSWRAGKSIPIGELLRRLEALARELKPLDQETLDRASLLGPAKELASQNLLSHKDKGVRAWTAVCLAEALRLCAPEAPFTAAQLKDIFNLFVNDTISAISDNTHPYHPQHLYVLTSLSDVKSIVLISDVPSSSKLIHNLFTTCFDILASQGDTLSKQIEFNMTGLLTSVIDESDSLPNAVVETILSQFLRVDPKIAGNPVVRRKRSDSDAIKNNQSIFQLKDLPPSYNMARSLCNSSPDHMIRHISQYFSHVITETGLVTVSASSKSKARKTDVDSDDEQDVNLSESYLKDLERVHRLLRELWRSCPAVVQNVIPLVEAELLAENLELRLLATETLGDLAAGVGAAGPPPPPTLDPIVYPPVRLSSKTSDRPQEWTVTTPSSPQSFEHTHPGPYQAFLGRRNDKSAVVRAAWTTSIARVLSTSAGGIGLSVEAEASLTRSFAQMFHDSEEKVRIAAVRAVSLFDLRAFISVLGSIGGVDDQDSVLFHLVQRVKDLKSAVRAEAIELLGKLWGVAAGEIAADNERAKTLLGPIPSRILNAFYVNDAELNVLIDRVFFDSMLPLSFPAISKKKDKLVNNTRALKSQSAEEVDSIEVQTDRIRSERMLLILADLDERSKTVYFLLMSRSGQYRKYMTAFTKACESYNGGIMDKDPTGIKKQLGGLIDFFAGRFPDPSKASEDIWKFAKQNDRRNYALVKFTYAPDSDYKKILRSIKELRKRNDGLSETMDLLVLRNSNLFYNRSYIHPIIQISQTDKGTMGSAAQELLKEITAKNPEVFKTHAEELCRNLEKEAPTATRPSDPAALDALKACATFAKRYPQEVSDDRKFLQAMVQYALRGSPPTAAKHAVTILLASSERRDFYARDLLQKCLSNFQMNSADHLSKLACLSQLVRLYGQNLEDDQIDQINDIAIKQVLHSSESAEIEPSAEWLDDVALAADKHCTAKLWALKILVNRIRAYDDPFSITEISPPIYKLLNQLITNNGVLPSTTSTSTPKSKAKSKSSASTASSHLSRLRLHAALLHLKLATHRPFEPLLTTTAFNSLALLAQDPLHQVRERFINTLRKYLGQERLSSRFYTIPFLLAFEPHPKLFNETLTWLRARAALFRRSRKVTLEETFARLVSLLAWHPDFPDCRTKRKGEEEDGDVEDNGEEDDDGIVREDLLDFAHYIIFYLRAVATEPSLAHIYHIAQRIKSAQDGISISATETPAPSTPSAVISSKYNHNLYTLSDLSQAVIRAYEEAHNWNLQSFAGKFKMPRGLFHALPDAETARIVAGRSFVSQEVVSRVEVLVKESGKSRKRKSDAEADGSHPSKRRNTESTNLSSNDTKLTSSKTKTLPVRRSNGRSASIKGTKTPKHQSRKPAASDDEGGGKERETNVPSSERRKSGRTSSRITKSYAEKDESEDDAEMQRWDRKKRDDDDEEMGVDGLAAAHRGVEEVDDSE